MNESIMKSNAIRALSMDAVQAANSGHPGMPMGMADIAEVLWSNHLKHNPKNPKWFNRDRFVLSNGHGSMLLYSLLHLTGYDLSIDDLKNFRKLHSKTAGHPEYGYADGIETTTGPLGQGLANAVGMALAEKILANSFNKVSCEIIDHHTYVFMGDGCLMEGVSHEASALAAQFKLGKLIAFWDDNNISIDGDTSGWFTENVAQRYKSYGWNVIEKIDGHNHEEINKAIMEAKKSSKPTLICCKTVIGFGSPAKSGTASVHGSALGVNEIKATKKALNWEYGDFEIPDNIYEKWSAIENGNFLENEWKEKFAEYQLKHPVCAKEFTRRIESQLPECFESSIQQALAELVFKMPKVATRKASQMSLDVICKNMPEMLGGSADLTGSNLTNWSGCKWLNHNENGDYISYGVREFGMSAIMNGIQLHSGFRPFGGTFLVFSDYARNAIRMSSLMGLPVTYVMTHDSIGLGEDGPTHQPIEHISSLRLIPNLNVWRPADAFETQIAWKVSCESKNRPNLLALSRQALPALVDNINTSSDIEKGGYILKNNKNKNITLISTGSEVSLIIEAADLLLNNNIIANIVSIPCLDIFMEQPLSYRNEVIGEEPIVIVEAGTTPIWYQLLHNKLGIVLGIDSFGLSAPADDLYNHFGITAERIKDESLNILKNK